MPYKKDYLTDEEKEMLPILLEEARSRGLLPQIHRKVSQAKLKTIRPFAKDENGYYYRYNGKNYNPKEEQPDFIRSNAFFCGFIGGRGCIAPETFINGIPIAERNKIDFVDTLYGKSISTPGYLKDKAPLYLVKTRAGAEVLVTKYHRFLSLKGWLPLNLLQVGDAVFSDGTWHVEMGREIKPNSLGHYSLELHLNDELHNLLGQVALSILQQLHKIVYDGSAWVDSYLLSIVDSFAQLLFRLFLGYSISLISYEQLLHECLNFFRSHLFPLHLNIVEQCHLYSNKSFLDGDYFSLVDPKFLHYIFSQYSEQFQHLHLKESLHLLQFQVLEFFELLVHDSIFEVCQFSLSRPPINTYNYTSFFDFITDIKFSREGEFYDLTVPYFGHYSAQGLYHHNSGKSSAGVQKVLPKIEAGEPGIVINPDFENFKISTWPEFREWIPWDRVVPRHRGRRHPDWTPQGPFWIVFDTGSWVICKGLKDPESARGPNVNWLWYDEAERDRTGLGWKLAVASVRISISGMPTQRIATATPNWQAPWLEDLFYKKNIPQDALEAFNALGEDRPVIEYFHGTAEGNRENLDPAFYATLLASYPPGYLRDQEVHGRFVKPSGVLGNPAWFDNHVLDKAPEEKIKSRIRYWDLAGSLKKLSGKKSLDPDENVGTLLSWFDDNKFCIEEQNATKQLAWEDFKQLVAEVAVRDGPYVKIYFEQEPAAGGVNQVEEFKTYIRDNVGPQWTVEGHKPEGDKVIRANPWFAEAKLGLFYMVKGTWNEGFLEQLGGFPEVLHDDRVDSVSGARQIIAPFKTWKTMEFLSLSTNFDKKEKEDDVIIGL